jgi:hypothetical protein
MQGGEHLLALRLVQQRQPGEQLRKLRRFHCALPIDDDRGWTAGWLSSSTLIHIQRVQRLLLRRFPYLHISISS